MKHLFARESPKGCAKHPLIVLLSISFNPFCLQRERETERKKSAFYYYTCLTKGKGPTSVHCGEHQKQDAAEPEEGGLQVDLH